MLSIDEFIRQNFTSPVTREELLTELDITVQRLEQTEDCAEQRRKLRQLAAAAKQPLIVMVMGEFKSGKSTFINTLLGRQLLQTDSTPATAVVTMLTGGSPEKVVAHRLDGTIKEYSFQDLPMLTAAGDKGQELRDQLEYVQITLDSPTLNNLIMIDTPGLNDADKNRSAATKRFMDRADMVIWVFRPEVKRSEIAIIDKLPQHIKPLGIINRIDEIDDEDDDIDETVTNIRRSIGHRVSELYPLSAYQAQTSLYNEDIGLYTSSRWAEFLYGFGRLVERSGALKQHILIKNLLEAICSWKDTNLSSNVCCGQLVRMILCVITNKPELYAKLDEDAKCMLLIKLGCFYVADENSDKAEIAENCLRYAALQDHVVAQKLLGELYMGVGSTRTDFQQAVYWFSKAANQGDVNSQIALAELYEKGKVVEPDYTKAIYWYGRAAAQGCDVAQNHLGNLYGEENGIGQDWRQAAYWYEKAAAQGYAVAQHSLGCLYLHGLGVEQDYGKAIYWYRKAAEEGYAIAQHYLGLLYEQGFGVKQNYKWAMYWYEKAAEQGYTDAQTNLGWLYIRHIDYRKAIYWYTKAVENFKARLKEWWLHLSGD